LSLFFQFVMASSPSVQVISPASQSVLHRTKLCLFHRRGTCTRGSACTFAHDAACLNQRPDLCKTKLCRNLPNCNDFECRFAHRRAEIRKGGFGQLNSVASKDTEAATVVKGEGATYARPVSPVPAASEGWVTPAHMLRLAELCPGSMRSIRILAMPVPVAVFSVPVPVAMPFKLHLQSSGALIENPDTGTMRSSTSSRASQCFTYGSEHEVSSDVTTDADTTDHVSAIESSESDEKIVSRIRRLAQKLPRIESRVRNTFVEVMETSLVQTWLERRMTVH